MREGGKGKRGVTRVVYGKKEATNKLRSENKTEARTYISSEAERSRGSKIIDTLVNIIGRLTSSHNTGSLFLLLFFLPLYFHWYVSVPNQVLFLYYFSLAFYL